MIRPQTFQAYDAPRNTEAMKDDQRCEQKDRLHDQRNDEKLVYADKWIEALPRIDKVPMSEQHPHGHRSKEKSR